MFPLVTLFRLLEAEEAIKLQKYIYKSVFTVEPESDFLTWKTRITEVEMEAQKVMKRFLDKCAAYKAS